MEYIIFDLEATCWKDDKSKVNEIIEIGAVRLDADLNQVDQFDQFVRPTTHPELSQFCTELTSITQGDVDTAPTFGTAMAAFEEWILRRGQPVALCSWGFYDKKQIKNECELKQYSGEIPDLLENHISVKHQFAKARKVKPPGMHRALKMVHMPLEGTHHRAIDDAKNITKLFRSVFPKLVFPKTTG